MLLEHLPALNAKRIVLGSASPRRRELLQQIGLRFEVVVSSFEETLPHDRYSAAGYAEATAAHKAQDIARTLAARAEAAAVAGDAARGHAPDLVICADTVVEHEGGPAGAWRTGLRLRMGWPAAPPAGGRLRARFMGSVGAPRRDPPRLGSPHAAPASFARARLHT